MEQENLGIFRISKQGDNLFIYIPKRIKESGLIKHGDYVIVKKIKGDFQ